MGAMIRCGSGRRRLPTFRPSGRSLRHPLEYSGRATTPASRSRRLSLVCGVWIARSFETGPTSWEQWTTNWCFAEAGVVVPRCSEAMRTTSVSHDCSTRQRRRRGSARSSFIRIGQGEAWAVASSRCANARRGPRDLLSPSLSRHCPESGSMLGMGMLRLGDAATFCPEASASTLFQCAGRSDSRAPAPPNKSEPGAIRGWAAGPADRAFGGRLSVRRRRAEDPHDFRRLRSRSFFCDR
jgi:hypothetical protein